MKRKASLGVKALGGHFLSARNVNQWGTFPASTYIETNWCMSRPWGGGSGERGGTNTAEAAASRGWIHGPGVPRVRVEG
jgi:hypothetical protein